MQKERFKLGSFVSLILRRDNQILLIRRSNTGCEDGLYGCAGGGIDGNEPATQALIREAAEELGIAINKENVKAVHIVHRYKTEGEMIGFFFEVSAWQREPQNMEPHKHDDVAWFDVDKLPGNVQPALKHVLAMIEQNKFFSEMGFE